MTQFSAHSFAVGGIGFGRLATATLGAIGTTAGHSANRRAIAVQGIGFSARLVALQGFGTYEPLPQPSLERVSRPTRKRRHRDEDDDVLIFIL